MKKIYLFVIFCLTFSVLSFGQKYYSASDEKYYELSKDAVGLKSAALSVSDTVIAGDHVSDYSSDYTRGYYFQAQSSFVIRELMCAEEANPGAARQSVEVILFGAEPPVAYPGPGGEHTTLFSAIDVSSGWIECGVDVVEGSYYGIIGAKHDQGGSTMYNSYGDSQDLMIDGISTSCNRLILQQSLATGSPLSGSYMSDPGSIGRIHFIVGRYWEDIVVDNDPGICGAVVNYTVPTVEGAIVTQIDASGLTSGDEFPVGVTMQEFLIDYGEGVTETRSFTVTVNDTEPPVLDCPENIVVSNDSGECGAVVTFNALTDEVLLDEVLAGSLAGWGITDEQYNPILSFEEIVSPFDGTSAIQTSVVGNTIMMCETKAVTKTYDIIGNSATVDLKVYLEFASNLTTYNFPYIVAELLDENDNSLGQHVYYGKDMVGSFFLNSHILTNPDSYTELPSATGDMVLDLARIGEDIDFNKISIKLCNYACEGENSIVFDHLRAINSGLGGGTGESGSVASDNCPGVQVEASIPSGSFFQVGTTPVTLTATDAAGNITSCSFNVTVNDTEAPVAICKEGATGVAAYVSSTAGEPWGQPTGKEAMDLAFGSGNWEQLYFETADLAVLLSDAYSFIYIEGGDGNANSMEAFIDAHITEMENWVANGGNLFLNAAPNVGDGMSWGFWGVELYYPDASNSVEATDPSHPIFNGPFTPVIAGPYTGGSYAHATIPEALNVTVLLQNTEDPTKHVLSYAEWGLGRVLFGGMTATYFHSPQPEALNLRANMFDFLSKRVSEFELDENGEVVITPEDIDGGSTDNCGIENMEVNPSEFGIEDLGEQEVTLTVTDAAGNTSSCTATVIIVANSDGPVVVANPIDVYLDETGGYTLAPEDLEMMADGTTDNYTPFEELELSAYPHIFNCGQVGEPIHTRLTVEDNEGNISRAWTVVTVYDTIAPVFAPVADVEIVLEPGVAETAIEYPAIEVTDNCMPTPELIEGHGPDGIFPAGTTIEKWAVEDVGGNTDTLSFAVTVITTNDLPTIDAIDDVTADEDASPVTVPLTGISYGNDIEEQTVTITAENDNAVLISSIVVGYTSGSTGSLEIELLPDASGSATITVTVEDSEGGMVTETFMLTVNPVNDAPYLVTAIDDQMVNASYVLKVEVSSELGVLFDDIDGDELTISAMLENGDPLPEWAEMVDDTLVFSPMIEDMGCIDVVVKATDTEGAFATDTFRLCVEGYPVSAEDISAETFSVNLYPNPARNNVNLEIKSSGYGPVDVSVYTITGKEVLRRNFGNSSLVTFSMEEQVSGVYFVKLQKDGQIAVKKLVLESK